MWRQKSRKKCWPERQIQPGCILVTIQWDRV